MAGAATEFSQAISSDTLKGRKPLLVAVVVLVAAAATSYEVMSGRSSGPRHDSDRTVGGPLRDTTSHGGLKVLDVGRPVFGLLFVRGGRGLDGTRAIRAAHLR